MVTAGQLQQIARVPFWIVTGRHRGGAGWMQLTRRCWADFWFNQRVGSVGDSAANHASGR